jgi:hypothetical protein
MEHEEYESVYRTIYADIYEVGYRVPILMRNHEDNDSSGPWLTSDEDEEELRLRRMRRRMRHH